MYYRHMNSGVVFWTFDHFGNVEVNFSVFLFYDLLVGKIESVILRDRINYTRLQYDPDQRNLRHNGFNLIRVKSYTRDWAHYQPFSEACRYFNRARTQFFESALRNIFRHSIMRMDDATFKWQSVMVVNM